MYVTPSTFYQINLSDREMRLPWIGSEKHELYKEHGFHTGIDLYAENVYSLCSGVVTHVGTDGNHYAVTVQYDGEISLRYLHLKSISVVAGQTVQQGFGIGVADKYVHLEYATKTKGDSIWSVRIGTQTYYKHNPLEINMVSITDAMYDTSDIVEVITDETQAEFRNGKGGSD